MKPLLTSLLLSNWLEMERKGWVFAYREKVYSGGGCNAALIPVVRAYSRDHPTQNGENFLEESLARSAYFYGNLVLGDLSFFLSPAYKSFVQH